MSGRVKRIYPLGRTITTLRALDNCAKNKGSVVMRDRRMMPAAYLIGMPGRTILREIKNGMWVYEKKSKEK